jgi:NADPH-dependent F420 reductase
MKIAIVGIGNVGGALGKRLAAAGHQVLFGTRPKDSDKAAGLAAAAGPNASATPLKEAAAAAAVIVLATPYNAATAALASLGDLSGKTVVDATNPLTRGADGLGLAVGFTTSAAEGLAAAVPTAHVFKAFNQTGFENMADPARLAQRPAIFVAGDDAERKAGVLQLVEDVGFEAVDAGPLKNARLLEPLAMLWIDLAYNLGQGRDFAFAITRTK